MPKLSSLTQESSGAVAKPTNPQSHWVEKTIEVVLDDTDKKKKVKARVFGQIAVHPSLEKSDRIRGDFTISSVTIGVCIVAVSTEADAFKIGEVLWRKACLAFREKEWQDVIAKLPPWVIPWCRAMRNAVKYLDYEPYLTREKVKK